MNRVLLPLPVERYDIELLHSKIVPDLADVCNFICVDVSFYVEVPEGVDPIQILDSASQSTWHSDVVLPPVTWETIRIQRNALLTQCDWTKTTDAPLTPEQSDAWGVYRQALRDIPETYSRPEDVVWPTPPGE